MNLNPNSVEHANTDDILDFLTLYKHDDLLSKIDTEEIGIYICSQDINAFNYILVFGVNQETKELEGFVGLKPNILSHLFKQKKEGTVSEDNYHALCIAIQKLP